MKKPGYRVNVGFKACVISPMLDQFDPMQILLGHEHNSGSLFITKDTLTVRI
jgi:hypothetical protein